jgi:uncharacterized membrane protein YccF (DUF307 family)
MPLFNFCFNITQFSLTPISSEIIELLGSRDEVYMEQIMEESGEETKLARAGMIGILIWLKIQK